MDKILKRSEWGKNVKPFKVSEINLLVFVYGEYELCGAELPKVRGCSRALQALCTLPPSS